MKATTTLTLDRETLLDIIHNYCKTRRDLPQLPDGDDAITVHIENPYEDYHSITNPNEISLTWDTLGQEET